ncbi:hypothetical protein SAMN02745866_04150 [Alteromonadaceae bacterium Bs31]|nr:hypothetical protein SAMN02745866_04150 [Alteromonadaceae bacterium Bs31]
MQAVPWRSNQASFSPATLMLFVAEYESNMSQERLAQPRYMVHWQSRIMTRDRQVHSALVEHIAQKGVSIKTDTALTLGSDVNIEFYIKYRDKKERIRAKTKVIYCRVLSSNQGVVLELKFTHISGEEMHIYNNTLQLLGNAREFQLKL